MTTLRETIRMIAVFQPGMIAASELVSGRIAKSGLLPHPASMLLLTPPEGL